MKSDGKGSSKDNDARKREQNTKDLRIDPTVLSSRSGEEQSAEATQREERNCVNYLVP